MVEYLSLEIPFEAEWYYFAEDSIGIVTTCIEPVTPTPTPTKTPTAVVTETPTPTPPVETPTVKTPTSTSEPPAETPTTETPGGQSTPDVTTTPPVPVRPTTEVRTPTSTPFMAPPTAIDLVSFTAVWDGDAIVIRWVTSYEESTFGYRLYRSADGIREGGVLVTDQLIASQGTLGGDYSVTDTDVHSGVAYMYWLEEVEVGGSVVEVAFITVDTLTERIFLPYTARP